MNQKYGSIARVVAGALLLSGCVWAAPAEESGAAAMNDSPGDHIFSLSVQGLERRYIVHVPKNYGAGKTWPVVIMFHGGGGNAIEAKGDTGWPEKADQEGFLAVFPDGTRADPSLPARFTTNQQTWNDGSTRSSLGAVLRKAPDVDFVSAMLADLAARFKVDGRRIYATGFSNGASMTFRVARELSPVIAAAAPVSGGDWLDTEKPARAVPLLYITGTKDPLNPMAGGEIRIGMKSYGEKPPTEEMIGKWVQLHGCKEAPRVVYDQDGAKGVAYRGADGTDAVLLYVLDGHGHYWPGRPSALPEWIAGKNISHLDATDVIWKFFQTKTLPPVEKTAAPQGNPAGADKPHS